MLSSIEQIYQNIEQSQVIDFDQRASEPQDLLEIAEDQLKNTDSPIEKRILSELFESGPLKELFEDEDITEVLVNGDQHIYYEKKGKFQKHSDQFMCSMSFNNFIHKICKETHNTYDYSHPHIDTFWKGFRVHLIAQPLVNKPHLSFRRHPKNSWSLEKLEQLHWATPDAINILKSLVHAKKNIIVIGPTGTGKTSVLNSLLNEISPLERAVILEDSEELHLPNLMSVKMLTRSSENPDLKSYDLADLLKQSLRMRPERIILGEIRGPEAKDLLMMLSTGHKGGLCTLHADSAQQALLRLEMLVQLGAP